MKSKGKSRRVDSRPAAAEGVSSDEWFVRYLLNALLLIVLMLTAMGVALYLDAGPYRHDWSQGPGAGFLVCLLLCPMLVLLALGLAVYAGIRLFLRPRTLGHAFVRLALLLAHVTVLLVCTDTTLSTAAAVIRSAGPSSSVTDPTETWRAIADRDFSSSPEAQREGPPDGAPFSPPSGMGAPRLFPGGGPSSR
ncbi:MAG: hypothetical protein M1376_07495 [Planctomycetes bacterium]|nr:hypothetical protein [Planctomycetota bacterium]